MILKTKATVWTNAQSSSLTHVAICSIILFVCFWFQRALLDIISVLILYYFQVESNVPLFLILGWTSIPFTWIFRWGCLWFCCQRNGHSDQRKSSNQKSFPFWTPNLLPKNPSRGQNSNSAQTWKYHWSQRHFMWRQNRQTQGNFNKFLVSNNNAW